MATGLPTKIMIGRKFDPCNALLEMVGLSNQVFQSNCFNSIAPVQQPITYIGFPRKDDKIKSFYKMFTKHIVFLILLLKLFNTHSIFLVLCLLKIQSHFSVQRQFAFWAKCRIVLYLRNISILMWLLIGFVDFWVSYSH